MYDWKEEEDEIPFAPEAEIPDYFLESEYMDNVDVWQVLSEQPAFLDGHRHHIPDIHDSLSADYVAFHLDVESLG